MIYMGNFLMSLVPNRASDSIFVRNVVPPTPFTPHVRPPTKWDTGKFFG